MIALVRVSPGEDANARIKVQVVEGTPGGDRKLRQECEKATNKGWCYQPATTVGDGNSILRKLWQQVSKTISQNHPT